jgi:hypothetical protein
MSDEEHKKQIQRPLDLFEGAKGRRPETRRLSTQSGQPDYKFVCGAVRNAVWLELVLYRHRRSKSAYNAI